VVARDSTGLGSTAIRPSFLPFPPPPSSPSLPFSLSLCPSSKQPQAARSTALLIARARTADRTSRVTIFTVVPFAMHSLSVPSVSSAFSSSMFAYVKENQREGITWREHWENSNWESLAELVTRCERERRVARAMARGRKFVFEAHPSRHTQRKCMRARIRAYMYPKNICNHMRAVECSDAYA